MSDSEPGRGLRPVLLILSVSILLLVGVALSFLDLGSSSLPGTDLSQFHPSAVPEHVEDLKSPDASLRRKAATILWQIGDAAQEATPALLQAAKDADPGVREAAVKALGSTSQESQDAIAVLIEALQDDRAEVRATAATSLAETWRLAGRSGDGRSNPLTSVKLIPAYEPLAQKAVPPLAAALRDADARIRAHAAEALAETGPLAEPAVPDLVHILQKDTDRDARLQATLALANIGPGAKAAVPILVEKLRSEKADGVRVNTAAALGRIESSPETVVPALVETFLTDEHPDARICAMISIGQFGSAAKLAIPLLRAAAKDPKNQQSAKTMQNIDRLLSFIDKQAQGSQKGRPGQVPPPSQRPAAK